MPFLNPQRHDDSRPANRFHFALLVLIVLLLVGCSGLPEMVVTQTPAATRQVPTVPALIIAKPPQPVTPAPTVPLLIVTKTPTPTLAPPTATPLLPTATPTAQQPTPAAAPTALPVEPPAASEGITTTAPLTTTEGVTTTAPLTSTGFLTATAPSEAITGTDGITTTLPISAGDLTLEQKIGQMLLTSFLGLSVDENSRVVQDIQEYNLGGVLLFDYPNNPAIGNIQSAQQLQALTAALQGYSTTPLLIAADHEGGRITRFKTQYGFPATLSPQALGQADDLDLSRQQAAQMAETLAAAGVNLNLAPVVDLNVNPNNPVIGQLERSYSADPAVVIEQAQAFIEAHREQGVATTLKHFPGHGSAGNVARLAMFDVTGSWTEAELEPFAALIDAGQADAIMMAHIFNTDLDPDFPASLSQPILAGVLREQLGYEGVVISDDILAAPILDNYGLEAAIQAGLEAGVDIFTATANELNGQAIVPQIVEIVSGLVADGTIDEARIDQSLRRILQLKARLAAGS